ncbi:MAG: aminotransferase class I/II-fold pyridoxal phosphate-dependent enzyme [Magnetococcales bacterium]|nr:aminotransferase class I/II-fold pyridoxal phosphate-dependent enzyme [Magnetococcales bacterium]
MAEEASQEWVERLRAMRRQPTSDAPLCGGLSDLPALRFFSAEAAALQGRFPELPARRARWEGRGTRRVIDGRSCLTFSSYDYLGLSGHPEVADAVNEALARHGASVSASRLAGGNLREHLELENELAAMLGTEEALVMISGYGTNVALLGHLTDPHTLVLHDEWIHNSVLTGIRLSGAHAQPFAHNDWDDLERRLERDKARYRMALIVVEGVYSMDGDIPDLPRLLAIKKRHGGSLMVDEAHSLGVLGRRGFGLGEHCGLVNRDGVDLWMGTLSKTYAGSGGFVAGSRALIDYLRWTAPGHVFSVGLSPPATASALAALRIHRREPERVERLRQLSSWFREQASRHGLPVARAPGAIVPLMIGDDARAMTLALRLFEEGIDVQPVVHPVVAPGTARLRFFITSEHTREEIAWAVERVSRLCHQMS